MSNNFFISGTPVYVLCVCVCYLAPAHCPVSFAYGSESADLSAKMTAYAFASDKLRPAGLRIESLLNTGNTMVSLSML